MPAAQIDGHASPGFEPVRQAFSDGFEQREELGAEVAVFHRGQMVVELWGGWTDEQRSRAWTADTLVQTYSTTKPLVAACALLLVERGQLTLDAPVARWWPEFGRAGKESVTVRQLLSHQAGLVALRADVPSDEIYDWDAVVERLAAEAPWWQPGSGHGEHAYFYGHLVGELVRRADGRRLRDFFADEIAAPWRLDFQIGVRAGDRGRVATLEGLERLYPGGMAGDPGSTYRRALTNPAAMLLSEVVNSGAWMEAEVPAVNGFGTAAAIARFYQGFLGGGVLDGERLLTERICREATSVQASGMDAFLGEPVKWGLGFQLDNGSFGHGGLGGSGGYAVPELQMAYGYVTRLMAGPERNDAVADAAEACSRGAATAS